MHRRWFIHRDLKTSNLLYNSAGKLAVCDFGLARKYEEPIRAYTPTVVTLYYRSPELLLGATTYSTGVDMWSVGCIFAELLTTKPLFPGSGELDELDKIFKVGRPRSRPTARRNSLLRVRRATDARRADREHVAWIFCAAKRIGRAMEGAGAQPST